MHFFFCVSVIEFRNAEIKLIVLIDDFRSVGRSNFRDGAAPSWVLSIVLPRVIPVELYEVY